MLKIVFLHEKVLNMTIEEFKQKLSLFKNQLEIVDGYFLSNHLTGKIYHGWITYGDSDKDWYSKYYCPELDEEAISILGMDNKNGFLYVRGTEIYDEYIHDLINGYEIDHRDEIYDEVLDNKALAEVIPLWKEMIIKDYDREEHIKRYVWKFIPSIINSLNQNTNTPSQIAPQSLYINGSWHINLFKSEDDPNLIAKIEDIANSILSPNHHIDFSEFQSNGLIFKIINYHKREVRLKRVNGLFGEYIHYKKRAVVLPNEKELCFPTDVYHPQYGDMYLTEIGKGAFESLTNTINIGIHRYVRRIEWSFWNCKKLSSISVSAQNPYFCSINGVLYTEDKKTLVAYPNAHGKEYVVPHGVEEIGNCAFKDCDMIEQIHLPITVKRIGINAFYRCTNLKTISYEGSEEEIKFEGFSGDYGFVNPKWEYSVKLNS